MAVSSSPHIIGRDRGLYRDDADTFRPERWLEVDEEQLHRWNKYDFNWRYGATQCLGKHIATMMFYKAAVEVRTLKSIRPFTSRSEMTFAFVNST